MTQRRPISLHSLAAILALALPLGCGDARLDDAETERVAELCAAKVLAELEPRPADAPGHPIAAEGTRPVLSAAERAAISEARARQRAEQGDEVAATIPATPPPVVDAPAAPAGRALDAPSRPAAVVDAPSDRDEDDPELEPGDIAPDAGAGMPHAVRPGTTIWEAASPPILRELAVTTDVEGRAPTNILQRYPTMPELFFCYTVFENPDEPITVTHVWRRGARLVSKVELEVGVSPRWRTWSRQRTQPEWTGPWSCEVLDPAGRRVGLVEFAVGED